MGTLKGGRVRQGRGSRAGHTAHHRWRCIPPRAAQVADAPADTPSGPKVSLVSMGCPKNTVDSASPSLCLSCAASLQLHDCQHIRVAPGGSQLFIPMLTGRYQTCIRGQSCGQLLCHYSVKTAVPRQRRSSFIDIRNSQLSHDCVHTLTLSMRPVRTLLPPCTCS